MYRKTSANARISVESHNPRRPNNHCTSNWVILALRPKIPSPPCTMRNNLVSSLEGVRLEWNIFWWFSEDFELILVFLHAFRGFFSLKIFKNTYKKCPIQPGHLLSCKSMLAAPQPSIPHGEWGWAHIFIHFVSWSIAKITSITEISNWCLRKSELDQLIWCTFFYKFKAVILAKYA